MSGQVPHSGGGKIWKAKHHLEADPGEMLAGPMVKNNGMGQLDSYQAAE